MVAALLTAAHVAIRPYAQSRCVPNLASSSGLIRTIVKEERFVQQVHARALGTLDAHVWLDARGTGVRLKPVRDFLDEMFTHLCSAPPTWGRAQRGQHISGGKAKGNGRATMRFDLGWRGMWLAESEKEQVIRDALQGFVAAIPNDVV